MARMAQAVVSSILGEANMTLWSLNHKGASLFGAVK